MLSPSCYTRSIFSQVERLKKAYRLLVVTGPQQSGKTTFLKHHFRDYTYLDLRSPTDYRTLSADPQTFFERHPSHVLIESIERMPELLPLLQRIAHEQPEVGSIVMSSSERLPVSHSVEQSHSGKVAYLPLLPFSLLELSENGLLRDNRFDQMVAGGFPGTHSSKTAPSDYYAEYIETFLEHIAGRTRTGADLAQFRSFMTLLAGRIGQVLNIPSLANDVGISPNTADAWLSLLAAHYLIFFLPSCVTDRTPQERPAKLYFYDTGLLCVLLKIPHEDRWHSHYALWRIFENLIVADIKKHAEILHSRSHLSYYEDNQKHEVDLIITTGSEHIPVEIRLGETLSPPSTTGLEFWRKSMIAERLGYIVYGGNEKQRIGNNVFLPWCNLNDLYPLLMETASVTGQNMRP